MLSTLRISNYALIRDLDIVFGPGLNILTGETGAGKSILLGALGLILGNRAESEILLDKERKCVVEAIFEVGDYSLQNFFDDNNIDYDPTCIVRREISPNGKSRAFINDTPCTLDLLRELGSSLVEIHSQHNTVSLFKPSVQLIILDHWTGIDEEVMGFSALFKLYQKKLELLSELREEQNRQVTEQDYLQFQYDELKAAMLREGEREEISGELQILEHAGEIQADLHEIINSFENESGQASVLEGLRAISNTIGRLAHLSSRFEGHSDRILAVKIELDDLLAQLRREAETIELDPERLENLRQRLDLINHLEHKHGTREYDDLFSKQEELALQLSNFSDLGNRINSLTTEIESALNMLKVQGESISAKRRQAATELAAAVKDILNQVNLPDAVFEVEVSKQEMGQNGFDKVRFLFSAHKVSQPGELSKIASGGELSRIMLALKANITSKRLLPSIIFDEIDNGISGETISKVGKVLQSLAAKMQVLSITHQPSIAGFGDAHYLVYKTTAGDDVSSQIRKLTENERVEVLAEMLSGGRPSEASMRTARELLSN